MLSEFNKIFHIIDSYLIVSGFAYGIFQITKGITSLSLSNKESNERLSKSISDLKEDVMHIKREFGDYKLQSSTENASITATVNLIKEQVFREV